MSDLKNKFRLLNTIILFLDLDKSINFYTRHLGMTLLRRTDNEAGRFTLAFVGYGDEDKTAVARRKCRTSSKKMVAQKTTTA